MNGLLAKLMDWPSVQAAALMMPFHEPADLDAAPTELFKLVHGPYAR